MNAEEEAMKDRLREYVESKTERSKGRMYKCPLCGSGSSGRAGSDGAFSIDKNERAWKCFSCGKSGDIYDLAGILEGETDMQKKVELVFNHFGEKKPSGNKSRTKAGQKPAREAPDSPRRGFKGVRGTNTHQSDKNASRAQKNAITENETMKVDFSGFYEECHANLMREEFTASYAASRGLSLEACRRFQIGIAYNWKREGLPEHTRGTHLIIPVNKSSFVARATFFVPKDPKYRNVKQGGTLLFNKEALQGNKPVVVVEGELDAISIIQAGGEALGLGSTSNIRLLLEAVKENPPCKPLILALDNDESGVSATARLEAGLQQAGISFYRVNLYGGHVDANEAWCQDRVTFCRAVQTESERIFSEYASKYRRENSADNLMFAFEEEVSRLAKTEAIKTGFNALDTMLDGGMYEGLYIVGAISSLGKTTFCLQVADYAAQSGHDVMIVALEMSKFELMSKSLSRLTFAVDPKNAMTSREITKGNKGKALLQAAKLYKGLASNVFLLEGMGNIGVEQVREAVQKHVEATGRVPLVVVDYLQLLAPSIIGATDKQNMDKAVLELKRISRDFKATVLVISSLNRAAYHKRVSMEDFKESGAIEYSSDVLIGLQIMGAGKDTQEAIEEKKNSRERPIELIVLKNRQGRSSFTLEYDFLSMFNVFHERNNLKTLSTLY